MYQKLMALYDLSEPSQIALELSLRMGQLFHSELTVVHVLTEDERPHGGVIGPSEQMTRLIRARIDERLRAFMAETGNGSLEKIDIRMGIGPPVISLLDTIERENPHLVFLGTHGRTGLSHVRLGSVAEKILRLSPSPVWIARRGPAWPPRKLLLPVDLLDAAEESLALVVELTRGLPMTVDMLHVFSIQNLIPYHPEGLPGHGIVDQKIREEESLTTMARMVQDYPALAITPHVSTGPIAEEICCQAQSLHSDMILMPTHGRSGLKRLLMGSVAEHVARHAPCHVMSYCPERGIERRKNILKNLRMENQWKQDDPFVDLGTGD